MTINELLIITLIIYLIIIFIAYFLNVKWLYMVAGLLWFVPITQVDNPFIIAVSVAMVLTHGVLFTTNKKEEF